MHDDLNTLMQRIQALPDEELVSILEKKQDRYTPEAISIAEEEAESRGGLRQLRQRGDHVDSEKQHKQRWEDVKPFIEDLLSKMIGRPPSEQYPALSYVSIAMRLISFILAAVVFMSSLFGFYGLVTEGMGRWLFNFVGPLPAGVGFLLLYGSSKIINLLLDIEKNTRESSRLARGEKSTPPEEST